MKTPARPSIYRRAPVQLGLLLSLAWLAQPLSVDAQTQDEIDQQIQQLENAAELADQIQAELRAAAQQAEDEQQALLDKLGQTHDELQKEKQRRRALEQQLNQLLNEGASPADPATPLDDADGLADATGPGESGETFDAWLAFPDRRINPLGLSDSSSTTLGPIAPGVDSLRLVLPPWPDAAADQIEIHRESPVRVSFNHTSPTGPPITLATLAADSGKLQWDWRSFSPTSVNDALKLFDTRLRMAIIETRLEGVTISRHQFAPQQFRTNLQSLNTTHRLALDLPAHLEYALNTQGKPNPSWTLLEQTPTAVAWVNPQSSLTVRFNPATLEVTSTRGPGLSEKIQELKRQRAQWENDLNASSSSSSGSVDTKRIQEHIQSIDQTIAQLEAVLSPISQTPLPPGGQLCVWLTGVQHPVVVAEFCFD